MVWALVSIAMAILGKSIIEILLPLIQAFINLLTDKFECQLSIFSLSDSSKVQCAATLLKDIYIAEVPVAPRGYNLAYQTNLIHSLVPIVILFTILFSWPGSEHKEMILLFMLGVIAAMLITILVTAILLIGSIDAQLFEVAQRETIQHLDMPITMKLVIFLETGGRWLLPVIFALFCKSLSGGLFDKKKAVSNINQ